ncbi:hypothetical protein FKM82_029513, partial [Ascaphus truei]
SGFQDTNDTPKVCASSLSSIGTQTEWPRVLPEARESSGDPGEGSGGGVCESDSLNGGATDGIANSEGPREIEHGPQSPAPEEGGACPRTVQTLRHSKNELLRRNSTSDKLIRDGREKCKKLERKAASSTNLLSG